MSPSIFNRGGNSKEEKTNSSAYPQNTKSPETESPAKGPVSGSSSAHSTSSDSSQNSTDNPQSGPGSNTTVPKTLSFRETIGQWRRQLAQQIKSEIGDTLSARLNLSNAHPGGLAQLYAEHPTRLSNLVRDPSARAEAIRSAEAVLRQAKNMWTQHGTAVTHLTIGTATWNEGGHRRSTPILLRPIDIEMQEDGELVLTLRPGMEISNRLLDILARHGAQVDPQVLLQQVRTPQGFSPMPAIQMIRESMDLVPSLKLENDLTVGVFVHPMGALLRELGAPQWLSLSPLVRALAGDEAARESLQFELPSPNPHDRDPWEERGIGDQSPRTADVIEAATGKKSLVVEVPGNSGLRQVTASIVAEYAAQGRKVLVVSGQAHFLSGIKETLDDAGANGIANVIDASADAAISVQHSLHSALVDVTDMLDTVSLDDQRTNLRRLRDALASYTESLHKVFPQWGISAFDALQVLTDLTSVPGGPSTRVRLSAHSLSVLSEDQGNSAGQLLETAYSLGIFTPNAQRHWWSGVELNTDQEVEQVLGALQRLVTDSLPLVSEYMISVAEQTGMKLVNSLEAWDAQLQVLRQVRDSLDIFQPAIFERSAADMVSATASKQWRKDRGINMSGSVRRRLQKQARDLVRPGRYIDNLHDELVLVQERRDLWRRQCDADGWPRLPGNLDGISAATQDAEEDLRILHPYLSSSYGDLLTMDFQELNHLVERLLADPQGAHELPERVSVLRSLEQLGLSELVEDLRLRQVPVDLLTLELELAWWASALGLMLASEPKLGGFDPSTLQEALANERHLDQAQVDSLGGAVRHRVLEHRRSALASSAQEYDEAARAYSARATAASYYSRIPLSWDLVPVVLTSAAMVPLIIPWGQHIDVVVLAGVETLPLAEIIPIVARAEQVVAIGSMISSELLSAGEKNNWQDKEIGKQSAVDGLSEVLPTIRLVPEAQRINDAVVRLLSRHPVETAGVSIPARRSSGRVDTIVVTGSGMPAPGVHAIESSIAEVEQVVAEVSRHALERPNDSLAVIALNDRHAERIRVELKQAAATNPGLQRYIANNTSEPFITVGPDQANNLCRDQIILSVGYAKTPHGRVIHDFGEYSQPDGEQKLAQILRSVKADLLLVTSLRSEDIDMSRVTQPGAKLLVDLLDLGNETEENGNSEWPTLESAPDNLLVDLAERLYRLGLNVVPNLGVAGGMRIPLAIGHPEVPGELLVAILTDDDAYLNEPSLRVRDRLWPQLLEEQGWKVRTELSMAVFIDPNQEAEAIVQLVLDAVDEFYEHNPDLRPTSEEETAVLLDAGSGGEAGNLVEQTIIDPILGTEIVQLVSTVATGSIDSNGSDPDNEDADNDEVEVSVRRFEVEGGLLEDEDLERQKADAQSAGRGPRPPIARGLPLAAYGDDQLDEIALWVLGPDPQMSDGEATEQIRQALELTRRGAQSDAVLRNVIIRSRKALLS